MNPTPIKTEVSNDTVNDVPMYVVKDAPMASSDENGFSHFNLPKALFSSLVHMKYTNPTPVQMQAIPAAMKNKDVLGSAQTGTGKTGAFLIPILSRLMTDPHSAALIMTPTRELASQILVVARQMIHTNNTIRTALLIGGESMGRQVAQMSAKPRLVIGTPGRINDHLRQRSNLFQSTNMLVLDEADRMLDMGFTPQINDVIKHMPKQRQTLMFSATFPEAIIRFTKTYMNDPVRVTIEPERTSAANIKHDVVHTTEGERYNILMKELSERSGSIIMFIKTKHGADRMVKRLQGDNHNVDVIHGGLNQRQRDRAIAAFRAKKTRIMVATDVAARGLDVPHIEHVINYDLPQVAEDYVHRIGRTARAGAEGSALSMVMPADRGKWNAIQRLLNPGAPVERSPRREGGNRSGGRPQGNRGRNFGGTDREFEQKPRSQDSRPQRDFGDRPARSEGNNDRPRFNNDRPRSEGNDRPRYNNDRPAFKKSFDPMKGNEPNFNVEGANGENRGKPQNRDGGERNYNVANAGGEQNRDASGQRQYGEKKNFSDRKPAGDFKKRKFFTKSKSGKPAGKFGGPKRAAS